MVEVGFLDFRMIVRRFGDGFDDPLFCEARVPEAPGFWRKEWGNEILNVRKEEGGKFVL